MSHPLRLADLQALTPQERQKTLDFLVSDAQGPANGHAVAALARIRDYERRYEMTSEVLLEKLSRGEMRVTAEIAEWLFWVNLQRSGRRRGNLH